MTDKGRVIIADDHGLFRRGLRQLLEGEGYVVVAEVTSGDEALKSVAENPGCVLLLDITMPGMNGLEVVHRLAERSDDVKVVMLSAREDRDAFFSAISAGARGYGGQRRRARAALRGHRPRVLRRHSAQHRNGRQPRRGHPPARLLSLIHISEPTRLRRISYAVFCLKKKKTNKKT